MTQLTPNIYEVEVPIDAVIQVIDLTPALLEFTSSKADELYNKKNTMLFEYVGFDFKILGEVTKDESNVLGFTHEEIISLLQSKEIYFENPMGEPRSYSEVMDGVSVEELRDNLEEWQESENKVIKGKLIILEKL